MTFILSTISPNVAQADTAKSAAPLSSALCLSSGFTSQTRTRELMQHRAFPSKKRGQRGVIYPLYQEGQGVCFP